MNPLSQTDTDPAWLGRVWLRSELRRKIHTTRWSISEGWAEAQQELRVLSWGPWEWTVMESILFKDLIVNGKWKLR